MIIEEFIATYADAEMNKISKMSDEQLFALSADSKAMAQGFINPNARLSLYRASDVGKRKSPNSSMMLGKSKSN